MVAVVFFAVVIVVVLQVVVPLVVVGFSGFVFVFNGALEYCPSSLIL